MPKPLLGGQIASAQASGSAGRRSSARLGSILEHLALWPSVRVSCASVLLIKAKMNLFAGDSTSAQFD